MALSSRLSFYSGNFATVAHPGISSGLELRPVGPSLRFVSPHSTWVVCRAPESSRCSRRSFVSRRSCLKCEMECSRSCRRSAYVLPVLRSQARPSSDTASEGHRMDHHREMSVRWLARWRRRAAACVGRSDSTSRCRSSHSRTRTRHSPLRLSVCLRRRQCASARSCEHLARASMPASSSPQFARRLHSPSALVYRPTSAVSTRGTCGHVAPAQGSSNLK